jgi:hypothetical protein
VEVEEELVGAGVAEDFAYSKLYDAQWRVDAVMVEGVVHGALQRDHCAGLATDVDGRAGIAVGVGLEDADVVADMKAMLRQGGVPSP